MGGARDGGNMPDAGKLDESTHLMLSQALQDIRIAVSQLQTPGVSPLAALDANAIDALKELYYTVNLEDQLNAMPARRFVLENRVVRSALLPLVTALHLDPASEGNQKRWSVPMYQSLRLLSVLSMPIPPENESVSLGSGPDVNLLKLHADLARDRVAVHAFVALLQYYIERKAEKQDSLATAEETKLEDARIDNILGFFRNILAPPRSKVGEDITARDRGVHLALVGALVHADFYSTLALLFSSQEHARSQYNDIVFLVADIYSLTYRYTTPRQLYRCYREQRQSKMIYAPTPSTEGRDGPVEIKHERKSVFDEVPTSPVRKLSVSKPLSKPSQSKNNAARIRAALQRERSVIGGTRAVRSSARWMSRHSGGFQTRSKPMPGNGNTLSDGTSPTDSTQSGLGGGSGSKNIGVKRVFSARNAIQTKLSLNPLRYLQEDISVNSDILCMTTAKGRSVAMKHKPTKSKLSELMRKDLQEDGLKGIVALTEEVIDVGFEYFIKELRLRIEEAKGRSLTDENGAILRAQKAFLRVIGSVVGFQREKHGKVFKSDVYPERSLFAPIHENSMKAILSSDFKIAKDKWRPVEAGLELESFRLVFRTLVDSCQSIKTNGKAAKTIELIETATFAVLEMMKMLQGMAAIIDDNEDGPDLRDGDQVMEDFRSKQHSLTSREVALNTIEQLFERQEYLNAPADLAKEYTAKMFSFNHLTNIVEITHAFTTILLDEKELAHLQVTKKKKRKTRKETSKNETEGGDAPKAEAAEVSKDGESPSAIPEDHEQSPVLRTELEDAPASSPVQTPGGDGPTTTVEPKSPALESQPGHGIEQENPELAGTDMKIVENRDRDQHDEAGQEMGRQAEDPEGRGPDEEGAQKHDRRTEVPGETANVEAKQEGGDEESNTSDEEDSSEPEQCEVESVGIIRKFAHAKAIETLLLPVRAAICTASSLSRSAYSIPDGAGPLLSSVVVAKATHSLAAIWKVAKLREKGALCGQFFTFGTMHLLSIVLEAMEKTTVLEQSTLERLSVISREVTRKFFSWLSLSPGLTLDMFFNMDKGTCQIYATSVSHRKALLEEKQREDDSGNDSDVSALVKERRRGNIDFGNIERRASERRASKHRSSRHTRQNLDERGNTERGRIEEDEDVDDIDNLDIGGGLQSSAGEDTDTPRGEERGQQVAEQVGSLKQPPDSNHPQASNEGKEFPKHKSFCRLTKSKKKRKKAFDPFCFDEDVLDHKKKKRTTRKAGSKSKAKPKTSREQSQKQFSSSDEYSEPEVQHYASSNSDQERKNNLSSTDPLPESYSSSGSGDNAPVKDPGSERGGAASAAATEKSNKDVKRRRVVMSDSESE